MKKIYHNIARITIPFILFSIFSTNCIIAQGSYTGGSGGGYSSLTFNSSTFVLQRDSVPKVKFDVTVFPNPLTSNDIFKAKFSGYNFGEKVSIVVSDLIGSRLLVEEVEVSDEITINIPHSQLSKGIYLITFQYKTQKITRRFSYKD